MLFLAYLVAIFLWIPLAAILASRPSMRTAVLIPLVLSALAAVYEAYMSFVWGPKVINPIRVDILLVMGALGFADAIAGLMLLAGGRDRPERKSYLAAGALCTSVPLLGIIGFAEMKIHGDSVKRELDEGRRYRFEAAFRDDASQQRVFGNIAPGRNAWAGHYAGTGKDDRFAHLVVAEDGRYWLFHRQLYEHSGRGAEDSDGEAFRGKGVRRMDERTSMRLRRGAAVDEYLLDVDYGSGPATPVPVPMKRSAPPRFPRPASARDEVRFDGVYSATYGASDKSFSLFQVWLWHADGEWWARYVDDYFPRGMRREFIHAQEASLKCLDDCRTLVFRTVGRSPVRLVRLSPDEFLLQREGQYSEVRLHRGETLPGFIFDLAPVATRKEHDEWIKAVATPGMIEWIVPDTP